MPSAIPKEMPAEASAPHILFIDAYDSFSNNIIALLQDFLGATVTCIHIDDPAYEDERDFLRFVDGFDAVVAGPGPGTVTNSQDVGLIAKLWNLPEKHVLPVLGICLGFQSLALAFGATEEKLTEPRHGIITQVQHGGSSIFQGLGTVHATQYHSLTVRLRQGSWPSIPFWKPTHKCPELVPLAWDCDWPCNGPVLMAIKHVSAPFWGVQYHPESICTSPEGAAIVRNWWAEACAWNTKNKRTAFRCPNYDSEQLDIDISRSTRSATPQQIRPQDEQRESILKSLHEGIASDRRVTHLSFDLEEFDVEEICGMLDLPEDDKIILESGVNQSGQPVRAETGSHSIIGCPPEQGKNRRFEYHLSDHSVEVWEGSILLARKTVHEIWAFLQDLMESCRFSEGSADVPFWGGLVGYVSYEAGLETINVSASHTDPKKRQPDICFSFIRRSVVLDHSRRHVYVQSIHENDEEWVQKTAALLQSRHLKPGNRASNVDRRNLPSLSQSFDKKACLTTIDTPDVYEAKVRSCQESIRAGDSYEMCLTAQTRLRYPITENTPRMPWLLYSRLRKLNPAPFGAYMHLGALGRAVNIISSSPERFLSWTRAGRCQYRPIKGTVKKEPGVTRADAEKILNSSKERAENLMIVDLVRHDLHGVVGTGNVRVTKLMGVEEYETVYQLVSVIEGDLTGQWALEPPRPAPPHQFNPKINGSEDSDSPTATPDSYAPATPAPRASNEHTAPLNPPTVPQPHHPSGVSILAASLPPGSMTGAPKKRSCELLQAVEQHQPRGIYSGVLGYLDVGGGGDFAVVIRTAFRWESDVEVAEGVEGVGENGVERAWETWRFGAGGAVTGQSVPRAEDEEMRIKLESTLRVFG